MEGHLVVWVLPDAGNGDDRQLTAALDLALFTGIGKARNVINVLTADLVVICGGGGPGTASEAAHALNGGRPLILLAVPVPVSCPAATSRSSWGVRSSGSIARSRSCGNCERNCRACWPAGRAIPPRTAI
ncbi:MAG: hypothetical protein WBN80_10080 [Prochlorococcaceae cyanobacterium]